MIEDLTEEEKEKAIESLLFLNKKRDDTIKACTCVNRSVQQEYILKEEVASSRVCTKSALIIGVIKAK